MWTVLPRLPPKIQTSAQPSLIKYVIFNPLVNRIKAVPDKTFRIVTQKQIFK